MPRLTNAERTAAESELQALKAAQSDLLGGSRAVSVSYSSGGATRSVTYNTSNLSQIKGRIIELERLLGRRTAFHRVRF